MSGATDNMDRLCRILYDREPEPADYLGGAGAKMLGDAADVIADLQRSLDVYNPHRFERQCILAGPDAGKLRKEGVNDADNL